MRINSHAQRSCMNGSFSPCGDAPWRFHRFPDSQLTRFNPKPTRPAFGRHSTSLSVRSIPEISPLLSRRFPHSVSSKATAKAPIRTARCRRRSVKSAKLFRVGIRQWCNRRWQRSSRLMVIITDIMAITEETAPPGPPKSCRARLPTPTARPPQAMRWTSRHDAFSDFSRPIGQAGKTDQTNY